MAPTTGLRSPPAQRFTTEQTAQLCLHQQLHDGHRHSLPQRTVDEHHKGSRRHSDSVWGALGLCHHWSHLLLAKIPEFKTHARAFCRHVHSWNSGSRCTGSGPSPNAASAGIQTTTAERIPRRPSRAVRVGPNSGVRSTRYTESVESVESVGSPLKRD